MPPKLKKNKKIKKEGKQENFYQIKILNLILTKTESRVLLATFPLLILTLVSMDICKISSSIIAVEDVMI